MPSTGPYMRRARREPSEQPSSALRMLGRLGLHGQVGQGIQKPDHQQLDTSLPQQHERAAWSTSHAHTWLEAFQSAQPPPACPC